MSLANDYFLLYHGISHEQNNSVENLALDKENEFFSIFPIILSITRKDFDKIIALKSYKLICEKLDVSVAKNMAQLNHIQHNIIEYMRYKNSAENLKKLHDSFAYLKQEGLLNKENYKKLLSLFEHHKLDVKNSEETNYLTPNNFLFKDEKDKLLLQLESLKSQIQTEDILEHISKIKNYINNQKFSIGITGVMNAGKSTMLNALMGKEILGSAVVPETANLTIVKYAKQEEANVFYWNKQEWNKIEASALVLDSMKEFVKESKDAFKNDLSSFIKDESRSDKIDIKNLSHYTSAKNSNLKCNLIKYVELKTPLDFLSDGVEIVDTPGLEDPVIQ